MEQGHGTRSQENVILSHTSKRKQRYPIFFETEVEVLFSLHAIINKFQGKPNIKGNYVGSVFSVIHMVHCTKTTVDNVLNNFRGYVLNLIKELFFICNFSSSAKMLVCGRLRMIWGCQTKLYLDNEIHKHIDIYYLQFIRFFFVCYLKLYNIEANCKNMENILKGILYYPTILI